MTIWLRNSQNIQRKVLLTPSTFPNSADSLESFLGSMINALDMAMKFAKDPQCGRAVAFASAQVLQYCFDEEDLFPEDDYGILGLLDDAYFVHRFAEMLHQMYPYVKVTGMSYTFPEEKTLQLVRTLLPAGVCDASDRTCYNLILVASALFTSGIRDNSVSPGSLIALRVDEVISILSEKANK